MPQFAFAGRQPARDLAQTLRVTQLAKHHRDHLGPVRKASRVPLGLMILYRNLKLLPRNQRQDLTEYAAYSIHGGNSVHWFWFLPEPISNVTRASTSSPYAGLTTPPWWLESNLGSEREFMRMALRVRFRGCPLRTNSPGYCNGPATACTGKRSTRRRRSSICGCGVSAGIANWSVPVAGADSVMPMTAMNVPCEICLGASSGRRYT